jgi:PDZ domain-containing secreted protein
MEESEDTCFTNALNVIQKKRKILLKKVDDLQTEKEMQQKKIDELQEIVGTIVLSSKKLSEDLSNKLKQKKQELEVLRGRNNQVTPSRGIFSFQKNFPV